MSHRYGDDTPDEELMLEAGQGDEAAFEALYLRHRDRVVSLAYRFTSNRTDALDVMQEAFLYLVRKAPDYEPLARFTTFLFKIVRNLSITHARRRRRRPAPLDFDADRLDAKGDRPERKLIKKEEKDLVHQVLDELPDKFREILILRVQENLTYQEIGEVIGIPTGTAKSRVHYALKQFKEKMERRV